MTDQYREVYFDNFALMIVYLLFRILKTIIGWLPFGVLYLFSDLLAFFLYRILAYRNSVIHSNLKNAFPDKSDREFRIIIKGFFKNLSDILLEGIKGMSCSKEELIKRYNFKNPQLVQDFFKKGKSAIGLVAHYNNWEWGAYATAPQIGGQVIGVSKSIRNKYIDRYIRKIRSRFGSLIIDQKDTLRSIVKNKTTPSLIVLIADQSPSNGKTAHWLNFLNQDTAFLNGPDRIARQTNYPVIYFDVQRVRRGFYEITASILHATPEATDVQKITELYVQKLERVIEEKPENWLWSHRRWKKKRE